VVKIGLGEAVNRIRREITDALAAPGGEALVPIGATEIQLPVEVVRDEQGLVDVRLAEAGSATAQLVTVTLVASSGPDVVFGHSKHKPG